MSGHDSATLTASDLVLMRGGRRVLDGISLALQPGTVTAVLGPNGAGKSSLLKVLSGLWAPQSGAVLLAGRSLADWPARELAQVRAVLPQESHLEFPFTGREVVRMGRTPFPGGGDTREDGAVIAWAIHATDVTAYVERPYTELSGGERQRLQLARALAQIGDRSRREPHGYSSSTSR